MTMLIKTPKLVRADESPEPKFYFHHTIKNLKVKQKIAKYKNF